MHELEFEAIWAQEVHRVVAADPERKLSRPVEDGPAEPHHQLRQFLIKGLIKAKAELALGVLSYNLKRVINILGVPALLQALEPSTA